MKNVLIALCALLLIAFSVGSALALNDTEIQSIRNNVSIDLDNQTLELQAYIDGVKSSLQGYNLSTDQINSIANSVSAQVKASVETACNPYLLQNNSLANPLQQALDGAISNAMDRKFIDQRDWLRETYIKTNDQFQELTAERDLYKKDLEVARAQYGAAEIAANATYNACLKDVQLQQEQSQTWIYIAMGLAIGLFVVMWGKGIFRALPWSKQ